MILVPVMHNWDVRRWESRNANQVFRVPVMHNWVDSHCCTKSHQKISIFSQPSPIILVPVMHNWVRFNNLALQSQKIQATYVGPVMHNWVITFWKKNLIRNWHKLKILVPVMHNWVAFYNISLQSQKPKTNTWAQLCITGSTYSKTIPKHELK